MFYIILYLILFEPIVMVCKITGMDYNAEML